MKRFWIAVALGATVTTAGAALAADLDADKQAAVMEVVKNTCVSCHGADLGGMVGPPLTAQALAGKDKDMLAATILNGRPGTPMPAFSGTLDADEAAWLVAHLQAGLKLD